MTLSSCSGFADAFISLQCWLLACASHSHLGTVSQRPTVSPRVLEDQLQQLWMLVTSL
jgi:hypothetical protein